MAKKKSTRITLKGPAAKALVHHASQGTLFPEMAEKKKGPCVECFSKPATTDDGLCEDCIENHDRRAYEKMR